MLGKVPGGINQDEAYAIITKINGTVCVVYLIFMLKTLLLLYLEIIENKLIKRRV